MLKISLYCKMGKNRKKHICNIPNILRCILSHVFANDKACNEHRGDGCSFGKNESACSFLICFDLNVDKRVTPTEQ